MLKITQRLSLPTLLLAFALPTLGQGGPAANGYVQEMGNMRQELNLTEEQEDQMQNLRYISEKDLIKLKANLQTAKLELKKFKLADEPNQKKIHSQIEKVGQERTAIEKAKADHQLEVRKLLSEEQYKIFRKNMKARSGHRNHRKGEPRTEHKEGRKPFHK